MKTLFLSTNQVKALNDLKEYAASHSVEKFHDYGTGWFSTSTVTPDKGGKFYPLKEFAVVYFKDKYKNEKVGILESVSLIQSRGDVCVRAINLSDKDVVLKDCLMDSTLYSVPIGRFQLVEGSMPQFKEILTKAPK